MKTSPLIRLRRFSLLTGYLLIALLAVSCASTSPTETVVLPTAESPVVVAPATEAGVPAIEATPNAVVQAVATSRGDMLEATDPSTVSLASGQLQLVEFFRFT